MHSYGVTNYTIGVIPDQCAARSVGAATQFLTLTIQTLLSSFCGLAHPSVFPENYGPNLRGDGEIIIILYYISVSLSNMSEMVFFVFILFR